MILETRWVTQSEAARLEAAAGRPVNQSSISRFLSANADVPVRRNERGRVELVEYGALSQARQESLRVQDGREAPHRRSPPALTSTSRKRDLEIERLELDLAERKGEVIAKASVLQAISDAGVQLVQSIERRRRPLAERLVNIGTAREIEVLLKMSDQQLLNAYKSDLEKAAAEHRPTD